MNIDYECLDKEGLSLYDTYFKEWVKNFEFITDEDIDEICLVSLDKSALNYNVLK